MHSDAASRNGGGWWQGSGAKAYRQRVEFVATEELLLRTAEEQTVCEEPKPVRLDAVASAADAAADERREEGGGAAGAQPLPAHFGVEEQAAVRRDELRRCRGRSER